MRNIERRMSKIAEAHVLLGTETMVATTIRSSCIFSAASFDIPAFHAPQDRPAGDHKKERGEQKCVRYSLGIT